MQPRSHEGRLSDRNSDSTYWLMTNKPDAYLYGALLEAAIYFRFDDDAQFYFGLYRGAVEGLQNQNVADRYSGAVLQQRSGVMGP
jgi:hypothetical protein